jgi:hypothetical protein
MPSGSPATICVPVWRSTGSEYPASLTVGVAVPKFTPQIVSCGPSGPVRSASARKISGTVASADAAPPSSDTATIPITTTICSPTLVIACHPHLAGALSRDAPSGANPCADHA